MTVSLNNLEICEELNDETMEATRGALSLTSFRVERLKAPQPYATNAAATGSTRSICHIDGVTDGDSYSLGGFSKSSMSFI